MTASALIYAAAGRPSFAVYGAEHVPDEAGTCRLCGAEGEGLPWARWVKDTFVDLDLIGPGTIVCRACLFCVDDHSVALQQRTGKDKPQRMRNYSHVVTADGRWLPLSKAQKAEMTEALLSGPRVAVVALSGQKHLVFRARPGSWQLEDVAVAPDVETLRRLLDAVSQLYVKGGATKAMIETGEYSQAAILALGAYRWRDAELILRPHRGSRIFALAVWLAQLVEETPHDTHTRRGRGAAAADLAQHAAGLQGEIQVHDLDAVRGERPQRGLHEQPAEVSQPDLFSAADHLD